jgi:signal transduction histidine kinase
LSVPERAQSRSASAVDDGFVLDAIAALTAAPDYRAALSALARVGVPGVADWCTVHVRESAGPVRQLAAAHASPERTRTLRELGRRCLLNADVAGTLPHTLTNGHATLLPQLDARAAVAVFGCDPANARELAAGFAEVGLASLIVVPVVLGDAQRGALTWARGPAAPPLGASELALAERVAAHAGPVLGGAWRLEAERQGRADAEAARQHVTHALDELPDGFLTLDREGRITYVNVAAAGLCRVPRGAAIGRLVSEVVAAPLGGPLLDASVRALRTAATVEYETFHPPVRGWFGVRAVPTRSGTSLYLRDVTARRAADNERERLLAETESARADAERARGAAEYANKTKSEFLATMSHELRTPLNAILGYVGLLADGIPGPVSAGQVAPLGRVRASAQHLLALIEEILVFARLEAGTEAPQPTNTDVGAITREAAELVEPVIETHGLRFAVRVPDARAPMHTDVRKVRQILLNLLANAARFTPAGGEVTLTAERHNGEVLFTVRDSGVGIAPEHQESIFEPFWQVEQKLTRRAGGTGLGLSVSRRLARLLGGDVTVKSALGAGSVFTVRLPAPADGAPVAGGGEAT